MARLPLYLLLFILPLAVAGHNIGTGVIALILFAQLYLRRREINLRAMWSEFKWPFAASVAFVAVVAVSGLLNVKHPGGALSFVFGYVILMLLPAFVYAAQDGLDERDWRHVMVCVAVVVGLLGAVAAAQAVYGFKLSGSSFVSAPKRAQGFYSHPLTFAYVMLLFFPLGCAAVATWPRRPSSWVIFAGASVALYASQSRTVQAVAALVALGTVMFFAAGRLRAVLLVGALACGAAVWLTDNPVSERFKLTLQGGFDVSGNEYPDDRLAFWHVASTMIAERPVLGHGENLDTAYRVPYYEALGLGSFARKYEAHNMYLQVLVNGGVIGLGVFLSWFGWYFVRARKVGRSLIGGRIALVTLGALALAAMTQNAFQDSEVRFALTLLCTALWLATKRRVGSVGVRAHQA